MRNITSTWTSLARASQKVPVHLLLITPESLTELAEYLQRVDRLVIAVENLGKEAVFLDVGDAVEADFLALLYKLDDALAEVRS